MPYREYIVMTPGEIHDMSICRAIQSGAFTEVEVVNKGVEKQYIPNLR